MKADMILKCKVQVGACVKLTNPGGEVLTVQLVGPGSTDLTREPMAISTDSPLGQCLMDQSAGDAIAVKGPSGKIIKYRILEIIEEGGDQNAGSGHQVRRCHQKCGDRAGQDHDR
jgi:transcription elongation GreA/GreB family factor